MIKSAVKAALRRSGFRLLRLPGSAEYGRVLPEADYTPWNLDSEFLTTCREIRENTLVDVYRCWELWSLVGQASKLPAGAILEVGVWRGGTGALMARKAMVAGMGEPIYLCDTFEGVVKAGERDSLYKGGEHGDTGVDVVKRLLYQLRLRNATILKGTFPDQTGPVLDEVRFRLVHIDVDTYQSGKDVMEWAWERLVPGGIVVYDDYGFSSCDGIKTAVNEQASDPGKLTVHNLNGHAIVVKTR